MVVLTNRQRAVLSVIIQSLDEKGYPPTLREIGARLGISSTKGVSDHLLALKRKGFIRTGEPGKSRTIQVLRREP
jgi:repressor LexA